VRQAHGGDALECPYGGEAVKTTEIHIRANHPPVDLVCFIAANLDHITTIIQGIEHDEDLRTLFPKQSIHHRRGCLASAVSMSCQRFLIASQAVA
jgi:hypothetical protein